MTDVRATWKEDILAAFDVVAAGWIASGVKPTGEAFQMTVSSALIHLRDAYSRLDAAARAEAKQEKVKKDS